VQISTVIFLIGFAKEIVASHARLETKLEGIQGNAGTQFHDEYEEAKSQIEKFALPFKTLEEFEPFLTWLEASEGNATKAVSPFMHLFVKIDLKKKCLNLICKLSGLKFISLTIIYAGHLLWINWRKKCEKSD